MKQHFTDERTGIRYTLQGDYYLPDLQLPPEKETEIGLWGQRHKRYLKEYRPALYNALLLSGKLNAYLAGIDQQAQELMDTIIQQMAEAQEITETMKATDQMAWIGKMNNIRVSAMEAVDKELIYV